MPFDFFLFFNQQWQWQECHLVLHSTCSNKILIIDSGSPTFKRQVFFRLHKILKEKDFWARLYRIGAKNIRLTFCAIFWSKEFKNVIYFPFLSPFPPSLSFTPAFSPFFLSLSPSLSHLCHSFFLFLSPVLGRSLFFFFGFNLFPFLDPCLEVKSKVKFTFPLVAGRKFSRTRRPVTSVYDDRDEDDDDDDDDRDKDEDDDDENIDKSHGDADSTRTEQICRPLFSTITTTRYTRQQPRSITVQPLHQK